MSDVFYGNLDKSYPVVDYGEGIYLYDKDGKKYIDACGGAVVVSIGHGVREIIEAMLIQAKKVSFVYAGQFTSEPRELLAEEIIDFARNGFAKVFFVSGGSEATEAALKIARQYHLETGNETKYIIISRWQSYHGNTIGALSMSGRTSWRDYYTPYLCNFPHVSNCYCYRCPHDKVYPNCGLLCAYELERTITRIGAKYVSAFIAEPIMGGTITAAAPPPEYFGIIRKICDKYNVLLILDEVLCGFGRTGKNFGIDHWDIIPDLMACGKGMASGYAAIGAVLVSEKVYKGFTKGSRNLMHSHTFSGMPISCAIALSVQRYLKANGLIERSREMGTYLFEKAQRLNEYDIVGDIAGGKGLLLGIELVKNKGAKEPFKRELGLSSRVVAETFKNGMVISPGSGGCADGINGDRIGLAPPFTITKEQIGIVIEKLAKVIEVVHKELKGKGYME
jgi:adenosylmethionine-8-amino-7-oxononanoate aminotransferase